MTKTKKKKTTKKKSKSTQQINDWVKKETTLPEDAMGL